jgi:hypothetical protein
VVQFCGLEVSPAINSECRLFGLDCDSVSRTSRERITVLRARMPDADLIAVVYDPPASGFPHIAVLFDPAGELIAARPVESIDAGEAALVSLVGELTSEQHATA